MEVKTSFEKGLETIQLKAEKSPVVKRTLSFELKESLATTLVVITKNVKCLETVEENVKSLKRKFEELEENMEKIRMKFRKIDEMRLEVRLSPTKNKGRNSVENAGIVKVENNDLHEEEKVFEIKSNNCIAMDLHSLRGMILSNTEQFLIFVKQEKWMFEVLCKFCDILNTQIAILCRSKLGAMHLALNMSNKGYAIKALSGDLSKKKRNRIINEVKKGTCKILTITASLDTDGLQDFIQNSVIIIYNMPQTWESITKLFGLNDISKWRGIAMYSVLPKPSHYYNRFKHFSDGEVHEVIAKISSSTDKYCLFHV